MKNLFWWENTKTYRFTHIWPYLEYAIPPALRPGVQDVWGKLWKADIISNFQIIDNIIDVEKWNFQMIKINYLNINPIPNYLLTCEREEKRSSFNFF